MTQDQIIDKLRTTLSNAVDDEYKVVYLLCETRKLIEKYPPDPPPFALKLYCHWALHVDLTHPGTTFQFLQHVDRFAAGVLAGKTDIVQEHRMFREFLFLDTFRKQFSQLLASYGLPTAVCDEDERWFVFLTHYAGVIEDGSLSCEDNTGRLTLVRKVVLTRSKAVIPAAFFPFNLCWSIVLLDGRTMTVDVNAAAAPGAGEMISSGIRLH